MRAPTINWLRLMRYPLFPLALLYWGVIFWRNLFYTIGFFVTHRLPCKVISVGNLSLGGTGKTPAVIYLAELLAAGGRNVAILSRGYGRTTSGTQLVSDGSILAEDWRTVGDEPLLIARRLPGVPVVVDENRYRGGLYLVEKFKPSVIIMDDAFQHRRLERDLDIVLLNARDKVADHKLFPYGRLREPWFHLRRARIIFWTKTNLATPPILLRARLNRLPVPNFTSTVTVEKQLDGSVADLKIGDLNGKKVLAVSGLGDPAGFEATIAETGARIAGHLRYPDHHDYSTAEFNDIKNEFDKTGAELVLTTEKDMLKLTALADVTALPLASLVIGFHPSTGGEQALLRLINRA